jgi:RHS repeat-associated protein
LLQDSVGNIPNTLRFGGREFDGETGLYYLRARYYDPSLGRFISEDPKGLEAGVNSYVYVGNNPISGTDPSGLGGCSDVPYTEYWEQDGVYYKASGSISVCEDGGPVLGQILGFWGVDASAIGSGITWPAGPLLFVGQLSSFDHCNARNIGWGQGPKVVEEGFVFPPSVATHVLVELELRDVKRLLDWRGNIRKSYGFYSGYLTIGYGIAGQRPQTYRIDPTANVNCEENVFRSHGFPTFEARK